MPDQAAKTILEGVRSGNTRILIRSDARMIDLVQRLLPVRYMKLIALGVARAAAVAKRAERAARAQTETPS